jgi:hypothetical protein
MPATTCFLHWNPHSQIIEAIQEGEIPIWSTRESEEARSKARDAEIIRRAVEDGTYCPACKIPWDHCDCEKRMTEEQYDEGSDDF